MKKVLAIAHLGALLVSGYILYLLATTKDVQYAKALLISGGFIILLQCLREPSYKYKTIYDDED